MWHVMNTVKVRAPQAPRVKEGEGGNTGGELEYVVNVSGRTGT